MPKNINDSTALRQSRKICKQLSVLNTNQKNQIDDLNADVARLRTYGDARIAPTIHEHVLRDVNEKGAEIKRLKEYIETQHAKIKDLEEQPKSYGVSSSAYNHVVSENKTLKATIAQNESALCRWAATVKNKDEAINRLREDRHSAMYQQQSARQKLWLLESRKDRIIKLLSESVVLHELAEVNDSSILSPGTKDYILTKNLNNAIMVVDAVDARIK